ncbi:BHH_G0009090.mRNA.1.CDS.1 [Saccharomyces cerevisiae]|nr:BHH_G0009090.mRNA.1.CDS.1 [Saccharomyces cerevisiae]CAI7068837.1 BHH_G0009090.mRNA.1.CDS.1 [Saccharomyces cerevisiae]
MSEGTVKENNNEEFNAYHTLTTEEAAEFIGTSLTEGLTQDESLRRLKAVGENTLGDDTKIDYKAMVLHQVCNAMIMVLVISMAISFACARLDYWWRYFFCYRGQCAHWPSSRI